VKKIDVETVQNVLAKADLLYTNSQVSQALDEIAEAINQRFQQQPIICLSVMIGGIVTTGQLLPRLNVPLELDYIHATRYRETTQGDELQWIKYPTIHLQGQTVLIIDDILDEGITLQAIVKYCQQAGAKEVLTAVLIEKSLERPEGLQKVDFCGLIVPNRYVFGYGMDYHGQLRQADGIYAVHGL